MKKRKTAARKCSECIHEYACGAWNVGSLHDADATGCANYETLRDSTAYFIGFMEGQNSIYNGEKIERSKTWQQKKTEEFTMSEVYRSRVYTDRPAYADFEAPAKF